MLSKTNILYYKYALTIIFIIIMVWASILQNNPDKKTDWNYLFNLGYSLIFLFSGAVSIFLVKKYRILGYPKKALNTSSLGLISFGVGLVIWTFYNFYHAREIPFPSIADIFFVAFYPLVAISVFYYIKIFSFILKNRFAIEAVVILSILSFIILNVLNVQMLPEMPILEKILNIFYPLSSAIVFSGAIMLMRVGGGAIRSGAMPLTLGLITHGVADFFFSFRTANGTYWNGDYTDILFALSAYLMGIASLTIISNLIPDSENTQNS